MNSEEKADAGKSADSDYRLQLGLAVALVVCGVFLSNLWDTRRLAERIWELERDSDVLRTRKGQLLIEAEKYRPYIHGLTDEQY